MILDKKFAGTLDQGVGCLVIFDDHKTDVIYPTTLETISNVEKLCTNDKYTIYLLAN
jgi:26S proteasome regulatory subunit N6